MPLAVDPQFAAFDRQINQEMADVSAGGVRQQDMLRRAYARQMPQWDEDLANAEKGISDSYLARGVHSSGHRVQDQNTALRADQLKRGAAQGEMTDQVANVSSDVARQLAELRRKQAEQNLLNQQNSTLGPMQAALQSMLGG